MTEARISEIFLSYQGEGPFAGSRQLFIRFYGCNLNCHYCDTRPGSYRSFTKQTLLSKTLDYGNDYNELVITGGEPLLQGEFLAEFLPFFKKHNKRPVYLETNGTLPEKFKKIFNWVDVVAMDVKLPTSTLSSEEQIWERHRSFLSVSRSKSLIVKAVVTGSTVMNDIKKLRTLLSGVKGAVQVVLQPVTVEGLLDETVDEEMLSFFKGYLEQKLDHEIMVLGQMHKLLGIK